MVSLTLELCNAVIKNCGPAVHDALGKHEFLDNIQALTTGSLGFTVRDRALCLIQEWGLTYANSPTLYYAPIYQRLKAKGVKFPLDETVATSNLISIGVSTQPHSKKTKTPDTSPSKAVKFRPSGERVQGAYV